MSVEVILYEQVEDQCERGSLKTLKPKFEVPKDFSITGGKRKFIIARDGKNNIVVAIGPKMNRGYYYHKDILRCVTREFSGYSISGGGEVEFSASVFSDGAIGWVAHFSGESGDFGVYDPYTLSPEVRKAIYTQLDMAVKFTWSLYES